MFKIGKKLTKENYTDAANWCNTHPEERATISQVEGQYVITRIPDPTAEEIAADKRAHRNALLATTDKFMVVDFPITEEERENYKKYRQYLRDLTKLDSWPNVEIKAFEEKSEW